MMNTQAYVVIASRRPWLRRLATVVGSCAVAVLTLWSAGLPPTDWVAKIQELISRRTAEQPQIEVAVSKATQPPLPVAEPPAMPAGIDSSISETPLPFVLTGTIVGRNHQEGLAFIGVNETSAQTYVAQAILANGARISEIHTDHVILEREGQRARLDVKNRVEPTMQAPGQRERSPILLVGGSKPKPSEFAHSADPVADVIRMLPIYRQDAVVGFEAQPGRDAQAFRELGLVPGDLILSIDGATPADAEQMAQLFTPLPGGAVMTASIRRSGEIVNVSLDGRVLVSKAQRASESKLAQLETPMPTSSP